MACDCLEGQRNVNAGLNVSGVLSCTPACCVSEFCKSGAIIAESAQQHIFGSCKEPCNSHKHLLWAATHVYSGACSYTLQCKRLDECSLCTEPAWHSPLTIPLLWDTGHQSLSPGWTRPHACLLMACPMMWHAAACNCRCVSCRSIGIN